MASQKIVPKLYPLLVFLLACVQYVNTVSYDYAWDDKLVITANTYTVKGVRGLYEIFTKRVTVPFKSEYRPVPQALFALEYDVFHAKPRASHILNIFWFASTALMVYVFARFTFSGLDRLFAFLVSVLFLVHPLHVEVVANIKGRDEILALFFGLLSVILLVKGAEGRRVALLLAGAGCFAAAFLSKSNAVTFLPLVPLTMWYRSVDLRVDRRLRVTVFAVAASSIALVILIRYLQSSVSNEASMQLSSTVLNNIFLWTAHPRTIVPTALVNIARYAILFVYPHPLIHLYGYNQISLSTWLDPVVWIVLAGLGGMTFLAVKQCRRKSPFAFGVAFFAITYSVYSNLFFYAPDTMADRYMFIPSVGISIFVVDCVMSAAAAYARTPKLQSLRAQAVFGVFAVLLMGYFVRTVFANRDWRNDSTLIYNRIRYMQDNAAAQAIYGYMLNKESYALKSPEMRQKQQTAAMTAFTKAISIYPDFQAAWIAIGKLFAERAIYDKAELSFFRAQRLEPLGPDSYFCLGTLYLAQQDLDLAVPYLEKAVLLDPKMDDGYVMLGKAYLQANNIDNLGAMTTTARKWFPGNLDLMALQATYHFRTHNYGQAVQLAREVVSRSPGNILALAILASPWAQESPSK